MSLEVPMIDGLITESRFADPDAAYRLIVEAHRGLREAESHALNARLVLILANHAGDMAVLRQALDLAKAAPNPPVPA
jgi:Protein of unknown function (DUF2783)